MGFHRTDCRYPGSCLERTPRPPPEVWSLDSALRATEYRAKVNGLLWSPTEPGDNHFHNGCRLFRSQSVAIPDDFAHLFIYTATFGDRQYIVGMAFVTVAGDSIRLGYSSHSKHLVKLTQIWGFRVAIGSRGHKRYNALLDQRVPNPAGSGL